MAALMLPAGAYQPFRVDIRDRGGYGERYPIWAPSSEAAKALVLAHPSIFGLSEGVRVWRVVAATVTEQTVRHAA